MLTVIECLQRLEAWADHAHSAAMACPDDAGVKAYQNQRDNYREIAEFIVKAINCHDELVEALENTLRECDGICAFQLVPSPRIQQICEQARAALAKAREEP